MKFVVDSARYTNLEEILKGYPKLTHYITGIEEIEWVSMLNHDYRVKEKRLVVDLLSLEELYRLIQDVDGEVVITDASKSGYLMPEFKIYDGWIE